MGLAAIALSFVPLGIWWTTKESPTHVPLGHTPSRSRRRRKQRQRAAGQAMASSSTPAAVLSPLPRIPFPSLLTSAHPPFADISKNHQVRKQYTIQVGENELVLKARIRRPRFLTCYVWFDRVWQELELLDDGANVYKLIGPVLVKQDLAEAKANVKKRIEYISAEL
ncbi:hypothetical protein HU200_020820 [Digitaria exilis]|uniref:Uncharacterized protein n=1 Tax=Digitaria exilis TaxID=1010633 RepID=A0A835F0L6_9POAL|nr:hypothetical protein HU200_020820 [Digitaria exilis]